VAAATGRQLLAQGNADLLIWGALNDISGHLELRFVARAPVGHNDGGDHPGAFLVTDRLVLPAAFAAPFAKLLVAVAVAATAARSEPHRRWLEGLLTKALEDVQESGEQPPLDMGLADRATIQACYANVAAVLGHHTGDSNWYRQAAEAYGEAETNMRNDTEPLDLATVRYHLARVRQNLGERARDAALLEQAVAGLRAAAETLDQPSFPWEWATIQACLGAALYKLDAIR
jgi:hypothetical protein